ncbi:hypothetical protein R5H30_06825 [Sulfitobacter sp. D35]|uniref:hypothetical protein n=1 Tax=Sulfitobacter sp. D35 TaxID=3083252 RepID=UPI00296E81B0|nr:hypothetical protein [Sulfitobacter sp. D35]MDW4497688.1 hypothetical protein [Sulfitobacter sp. D35]
MTEADPDDPKGLIREAFRIDGISAAECRSIFLDWALSLPGHIDSRAAIARLLARHVDAVPAHPMAQVLQEGLTGISSPRRRGGWRGRQRN